MKSSASFLTFGFRRTGQPSCPPCSPLGQGYRSLSTLIVRTRGDARAVLPAIRDELRNFDPTMVVTSTTTMEDLLATAVAEERFRALLAVLFGTTALVLAAVGLYGLATRRVADRRREIAVRVALGARPRDVRGLVLRDAVRTVTIGLALGLPAAYLASRLTEAFLFGVSPTAPHIFASAAAGAGPRCVRRDGPSGAPRGRDRSDGGAEGVSAI